MYVKKTLSNTILSTAQRTCIAYIKSCQFTSHSQRFYQLFKVIITGENTTQLQ